MNKLFLKKGMVFIEISSGKKITYGKKNADGSLWCITQDNNFLTLTMDELMTHYKSVTDIEKKAKERRRRQAW